MSAIWKSPDTAGSATALVRFIYGAEGGDGLTYITHVSPSESGSTYVALGYRRLRGTAWAGKQE